MQEKDDDRTRVAFKEKWVGCLFHSVDDFIGEQTRGEKLSVLISDGRKRQVYYMARFGKDLPII